MITNVSTKDLLDTLKQNRKKHQSIFLEAVEGYRLAMIENLEGHLAIIKKTKKAVKVNVYMPIPEDHTREYDRVIGLLELSLVGDDPIGDALEGFAPPTVRLSDEEYEKYVLDKWDWTERWITSNSSYSKTAAQIAKEREIEADAEIFA